MKGFIIHIIDYLLRHCSWMIKNDETYLRIRNVICNGQKLRLDPPISFSEKIYWLKLHNKKQEFTKMVDKYEVKKWISSILGEEYLIPTLGVWNNFDEIDFESLPNRFVLKCTHDSGGLVVCKDKTTFDLKKARKKIKKSLRRNYYLWTREYPYKDVKPRVIAEKFMEDEEYDDLTDYKFFCFNGKAKYCQVISNRNTDESIDFYDRDWNHQPFIGLLNTDCRIHYALKEQKAPECYSKMLEIADSLALKINSPFVRIDQYCVRGQIYFGEITFFPAGGNGKFMPLEWNEKIGSMIDLTWTNGR